MGLFLYERNDVEPVTLITLGAFIKKLVDTAKFITNKKWNSLVTQITVWAAGVGVIALAASASLTSKVAIFGTTLGSLDAGSIILAGLVFSSTASVVADFGKQIDNQNTYQTPPLVPDNPGA